MTEESIEHLVTQRLDSLFGEDDEEGDAPSPRASSRKDDSPLGPLTQAAKALKSGIDTAGVSRLNTEVRKIQQARAAEPLYRPLLKMIGILADYLRTASQNAHEETVPMVCSIVECMRRLEPDAGVTDLEKKKRIQKEIESFKAFRAKIQAGKRPETAPEEAAEAEPPPPQPAQPPPAPEPTVPAGREEPAPPQAPPAPEPAAPPWQVEKAPPAATEPPDLSWIQEGFSSLNSRVDGMQKILESHASLNAELRKTLAQMANRLSVLAGLPESLKTLQKAVISLRDKEPAKKPLDREDLQRCVRDAVGELSDGLADVRRMPAGVQEFRDAVKASFTRLEERIEQDREDLQGRVREAVGELSDGLADVRRMPAGVQEFRNSMEETFTRLEERFKYLRGELHTIRADIAELRAEIEGFEDPSGAAKRSETNERDGQETTAPIQDERFEEPESEGAEAEGLPEEEAPVEEPEAPRDETSPSAPPPGSPALTYYLFQVGEKKYAVEQQYVVKASKASNNLRKKAVDRGGLTLSESTPGLFGSKKGLEPAWSDMPSSDWKKTVFRLVPEKALEGLDQTPAGGVLFLGVGEDRLVLFTDRAAEGIPLSEEDEIQMAGSACSDGEPTCGSILRSGDSSEFYLILAPERLS